MSKTLEAVIQGIEYVQQMSGRQCPAINQSTSVFSDIPGFTSLNGLEATMKIAHDLHLKTAVEENLFVKEVDGKRTERTVKEVLERIKELQKENHV
jgi:hypothetical protein